MWWVNMITINLSEEVYYLLKEKTATVISSFRRRPLFSAKFNELEEARRAVRWQENNAEHELNLNPQYNVHDGPRPEYTQAKTKVQRIIQEMKKKAYFLRMNILLLDGSTIQFGNSHYENETFSLVELEVIISEVVEAIKKLENTAIYLSDLIEMIEIKANTNTARKSKLILESWRKMFHSEDQLLLTFDLPMNVIGIYQPRPQQQYQAGAGAGPACIYMNPMYQPPISGPK